MLDWVKMVDGLEKNNAGECHGIPYSPTGTGIDVDYVITFRYADCEKGEAQESLKKLILALQTAGLLTEIREGAHASLLIFIKARDTRLLGEVYRSRIKDWLFGIRTITPERIALDSLPGLTEAERLRNVYYIITRPPSDRGAGVTPGRGDWKAVESIFPLHDPAFNGNLIKTWSKKSMLGIEELTVIKDQFGPKIAYYFAFLQCYFVFLAFPAIFGAISWLFLAHFSPIYAVVNCLWSVVFVEYWKRQEVDLAVTWAVRGVGTVKAKNIDFKPNKTVRDPVTGQFVPTFSMTQRLLRQLLQIPFALLAAILLGALIALCFAIEVFIEEVYDGPMKSILVYVPMAIITLFMPLLQNPLSEIATKLATYENYEIASMHEAALVQKMFVLDFITSFLPIFLVAFVYLPFGDQIVPYINFHHAIVTAVQFIGIGDDKCNLPQAEFSVDPERLKYQIIYFAVSAQGMNFINEVIVPFLKRKGFDKFEEYKRNKHASRFSGPSLVGSDDVPEEAAFLDRVRKEAELEDYDVNTDLREMCEQFGYLSLFSVVWPLTAVAFLVGNWFELRSDALKICYEKKRPVPWRVDTIGPWLDHLGLIAWLGSLSSAALVFLFTGEGMAKRTETWYIQATGLLLTIFFSEHLYLFAKVCVRVVLDKFESPGLKKERGERYLLRKRYMEESLALEESEFEDPAEIRDEKRYSASEESLGQSASSPSARFWSRQRRAENVMQVGNCIIARGEGDTGRDKLQ